jgi:hypothetical protein
MLLGKPNVIITENFIHTFWQYVPGFSYIAPSLPHSLYIYSEKVTDVRL